MNISYRIEKMGRGHILSITSECGLLPDELKAMNEDEAKRLAQSIADKMNNLIITQLPTQLLKRKPK